MAMGAEQVLWAPYVLPIEPNHWVMYFWAGTPDNRTQRADSTDLVHWQRDTRTAAGGRDPFVLKVGDSWYCYTVGVGAVSGDTAHGQIIMSRSPDLERWSTPTIVLEDPVASTS